MHCHAKYCTLWKFFIERDHKQKTQVLRSIFWLSESRLSEIKVFLAGFLALFTDFYPALPSYTNLPLSPKQRNKIIPRHRKTIALSANEKEICRHLAANNASECMFIYYVTKQLTSQSHCTVKITTIADPSRPVISACFGFHEWLLSWICLFCLLRRIIYGCRYLKRCLAPWGFVYITAKQWKSSAFFA